MSNYCIGVDLGGTFIKFGLLDDDNNPSELFQLPTPIDGGAEAVIEQMIAGSRQLMQGDGLGAGDVVGIGIGSPGPLDLKKGMVVLPGPSVRETNGLWVETASIKQKRLAAEESQPARRS